MKTYKRRKLLKKILKSTVSELGPDVIHLICVYSISSSYNEKLYHTNYKILNYVPLQFIDFNWNLFMSTLKCSHWYKYKKKKTITIRRNYTYSECGRRISNHYIEIACQICFYPHQFAYIEEHIIYDGAVIIPFVHANKIFKLKIF